MTRRRKKIHKIVSVVKLTVCSCRLGVCSSIMLGVPKRAHNRVKSADVMRCEVSLLHAFVCIDEVARTVHPSRRYEISHACDLQIEQVFP